jgi:hypothetical protein
MSASRSAYRSFQVVIPAVRVTHRWNDDNERLGFSGELPAGVVMMKHEERDSPTGTAFNFRHEHVEGEMQRRLALPFDAWEPIGRGESLTRRARAHLARVAGFGNGDMA